MIRGKTFANIRFRSASHSKMRLCSVASRGSLGTAVSTAVAAALADEKTPAPAWAKGLTDSVATLTQKHETLNSAQKTLQATVAKLERELEAELADALEAGP